MFATNSEPLGSNTSTTATMKNKEQELLETTYHRDYCDSEGLGSHVVYDSTPTLLPTEQLVSYFSFNRLRRESEFLVFFSIYSNRPYCRNLIFKRHSILPTLARAFFPYKINSCHRRVFYNDRKRLFINHQWQQSRCKYQRGKQNHKSTDFFHIDQR